MCEVYEVDPDGDLLVILPPTDQAFAPWDDSGDLEAIPELSENDTRAGINSPQGTANEGSLLTSCESPSPLHLKVSSKHLSLASPQFKRMLTGAWKEAHIVHQDGCRHVILEGFDPSALKLLLDILHGKTRKVPRSLDLEMLAKVSVLVDYFECYEGVEVFTDIWLDSLPFSPPTEYSRDLVLWILISSVFQKSKLFNSATRIAILYSTGPIQTLGLPVRYIIVDKIDHERQELLDQLMGTLHNLLDKLREGQLICSFECDSMLLGAFIKQLYPQDLIWPRPLKPFTGFQFAETAQAVRCFQSPAWCAMSELETDLRDFGEVELSAVTKKMKKKGKQRSIVEEREKVEGCPQHRCDLRDLIIPVIDRLENSVQGLDLERDIGA